MKEVTLLEERLHDFQIVDLVKAVIAWVCSVFCNFLEWPKFRKAAAMKILGVRYKHTLDYCQMLYQRKTL